ncbi:MAG: hypothetical protein NVSMB49_22450 [Ktedonobacteraceae bacterium]
MKPPIGDKFVAYGGPDFMVDTEVKGRVVAIEKTELYVVPYANYEYLLLEGNRRHPVPGEDGYVWYQNNILVHDATYPPIINMETYGVGGRGTSDPGDGTPPSLSDNGQIRPVQVGDHIRVAGLHVIDYSHPAYFILCTGSFSYMRGLYRACYAHTEIHPYNFNAIELITNLQPSPELYTEHHTVCAPIYPELYSQTYGWNKLWGVAGHLVDAAEQATQVASFFISAPPKPGEADYIMHFTQSDIVQTGQGEASLTYTQVGDEGVTVTVTVNGSDVTNPLVYRAKYTVEWIRGGFL